MMLKPATYWHMLPEYSQGRKAIWNAINPHTGKRRIDEAFPQRLRSSTNDQEMFIRLRNGATWQVVGSDRYDSTVGSPPYGLVFSEWALANPSAWAYLAPIVIENDGWALFITTSRGRNHAYSMLEMARQEPDWFAEVLTIDDTGAMSKDAVEKQRREYVGIFGQDAADALIEQEYFCSFEAAILGAFWGRELRKAEQEGRTSLDLHVNPDLPIRGAWDIGVDDPMAIWVYQVEPGRINVLDYYENTGFGFEHYAGWCKDNGYWPMVCDVPHDARARILDAQATPRTRVESMFSCEFKVNDPLAPYDVIDGVNAGRQTLPLAHFSKRCNAKGLECLRNYRHEWDEKNRVFRETEKHDWSSHGGSAWRYLSLAWRLTKPVTKPKGRPLGIPLSGMTMSQLHDLTGWDRPQKERV